ncbi:MAG: hypothetical protein ACRDNS_16890 [Trebonia sp.]
MDYLEQVSQASPAKHTTALRALQRWARSRELIASETAYVARTRDRRPLRFSAHGLPAIETAYRTHWLSPALSPARRRRLVEHENTPGDLVVIAPTREFVCPKCDQHDDLLIMDGDGPLCLRCARLDHLVYLPSGNATLTRRAKKASALCAVVVRFSRTRKRYERQGLLIEAAALATAEAPLADDQHV